MGLATRGAAAADWKSSVLDGAESDDQEKRDRGAFPSEAGAQQKPDIGDQRGPPPCQQKHASRGGQGPQRA